MQSCHRVQVRLKGWDTTALNRHARNHEVRDPAHRKKALPQGGPFFKKLIAAYATTSIPIDRAVPLMLFTAASTEAAFRSGIFCVAISRTCFSVTLPIFSLFGVPDPFATPAAFLSRTAAGGVLVTS